MRAISLLSDLLKGHLFSCNSNYNVTFIDADENYQYILTGDGIKVVSEQLIGQKNISTTI